MPWLIVLMLLAASCCAEEVPLCDEICIHFHENNPPVATVYNEEQVCRYVNRNTGEVVLHRGWEDNDTDSALYIECVYPRTIDKNFTFRFYRSVLCLHSKDEPKICQGSGDYFTTRPGHTYRKAFSYLHHAQANPEKLEKILQYAFSCTYIIILNTSDPKSMRAFTSNRVSFLFRDYKHLPAPADFSYQWHAGEGYELQWQVDSAPCDQVVCPKRQQRLSVHGFVFSFPSGIRRLITAESLKIDENASLGIYCENPSVDDSVNSGPVSARKRTDTESKLWEFSNISEADWKGEVKTRFIGEELEFDCFLQYAGADEGLESIRLPELQKQVVVMSSYQSGHSYLVSCQRLQNGEWADIQKDCIEVRNGMAVRIPPESCVLQDHTGEHTDL